jgi:hypothetical protein
MPAMTTSDETPARRPVIELLDPMIVEILRSQTPQQRLAQAFRMWETARIITISGIRSQHPDWSEEQALRECANRLSHGETERARRQMAIKQSAEDAPEPL